MGNNTSTNSKSTYILFWLLYILITLILFGLNYEMTTGLIIIINFFGVVIASKLSRKSNLKFINNVIFISILLILPIGFLLLHFQLITYRQIANKIDQMDFYYQLAFLVFLLLLSPFNQKLSTISKHKEFYTLKEIFKRTKWFLFGYFLSALFFSQIYLTLQKNNKCSFKGDLLSNIDAFYFSIVTQTTLGYGEIVPTSAIAKLLVTLHASLGVVGLAIIAGLTISIGLEQGHSEDKKTNL